MEGGEIGRLLSVGGRVLLKASTGEVEVGVAVAKLSAFAYTAPTLFCQLSEP